IAPSAGPLLGLDVNVENRRDEELVHGAFLTCQLRIDPARRAYGAEEEARLRDLFGERARWGDTMRSFLFTTASLHLSPFVGRTHARILAPLTLDLALAGAKYLHGLEGGEVPLTVLYSGIVLYEPREERNDAAIEPHRAVARV